ncbi:SH3 domain-containing protein [Psychrobacter sp. FDAARGOS_221]|uniref:SH3 domain-containing protein n=1 Tax=Psychrobacter sp. FDAARGOS_221 TaxID=1975705 RepID=UPI000BB56DF8|nr:SH3 domain-containing protein [Psychrobacter sp. FDAARGOS_221]PNK59492.1 SH3 domain-containing protein [Psychrobacter sp. FDAARGOS_221]
MNKAAIPALLIFAATLLGATTTSHAEFGKIVDADGYVNVRQAPSNSGKILGRITSGKFVYVYDDETYDSWLYGYPQFDPNNELNGYIHHSRVRFIDSDKQGMSTEVAMSAFDAAQQTIEFANDKVRVTIEAQDFDYPANKHQFTEQCHHDGKPLTSCYLSHYKGQPFWGTDGGEPNNMNHYKAITVSIGDNTIRIPQSDIESLFNIYLRDTKVYYDANTDSVYISATEGDGAGTYRVLFAIEQGRYIGKTVV